MLYLFLNFVFLGEGGGGGGRSFMTNFLKRMTKVFSLHII